MKIELSVEVQGLLESYNIFVDGEKVQKVRGPKTVIIEVEPGKHDLQLKSGNGKSSLIKIDGKKGDAIELRFITHYFKAFKEGYFELVED